MEYPLFSFAVCINDVWTRYRFVGNNSRRYVRKGLLLFNLDDQVTFHKNAALSTKRKRSKKRKGCSLLPPAPPRLTITLNFVFEPVQTDLTISSLPGVVSFVTY